MISLSREWSILSRILYNDEYLNELSKSLKVNHIETILDCGCGDGYILHGLSKKGFKGVGIDVDSEMISLASKNTKNKNISFKKMDWLKLNQIKNKFDLVVCRGNSLCSVVSWDSKKAGFDSKNAKAKIEESLGKMIGKIRDGGILYVDTIPNSEIRKNGGCVEIKAENYHLNGKIKYDWKRRIRYTEGKGQIGKEKFHVSSVSYLIKPKELEDVIRKFKPIKIWSPRFKNSGYYHIICAKF